MPRWNEDYEAVGKIGQASMTTRPEHIKWLTDTGKTLTTSDGKTVHIWRLRHRKDDVVLSEWARHFRNHYCPDSEIDLLRGGTGLSRRDYLCQYVFPDKKLAPGPSIRSGDFAEILMADFLQFIMGLWVPRFRYDEKAVRNESTKGTDILGFKILSNEESPNDILFTFEAKAKLTGNPINRLQDAVDDSAKDFYPRKAESLNALKRRYIRSGHFDDAMKIRRFQDKADKPYSEISGAAAVLSESAYNCGLLCKTDSSAHPNADDLQLVVLRGKDLMALVHELYRRASDEA